MNRLLATAAIVALSLSTTASFAAPARSARAKNADARRRSDAEKERLEAEKAEAEKAEKAERLEAEKKAEAEKAERLEAEKKKAEEAKAEQAKIDAAKLAQAKPATPPDADAVAAHAETPRPTKIELMGGGASQALGFGFGVRVGQTMRNHVYAGVNATLQLTAGSALAPYMTGEFGYEIPAGALKITPTLGAGMMLVIPEKGDVQKSPLLYPAVSVRYDIPETALSFGVDSRILFLTGPDATALALSGTMGVRF